MLVRILVETACKKMHARRVNGFWNRKFQSLDVSFRFMCDNNENSDQSVMIFASESDATKAAVHIWRVYNLKVAPQTFAFKYCRLHQVLHPLHFFQVSNSCVSALIFTHDLLYV